ncbi:MAG: TetR/AcrR family transcriptional regulator [Proteobacteria bacterium]|uniref:TetR/AcrR family transcriptional regulator n=1 Tax=Rudaea sp. TaxID=2136325 RepID=UPI003784E4DB|nr:TetR/AcrR family transcriptional regulator [Pseudomonadota bacterium]
MPGRISAKSTRLTAASKAKAIRPRAAKAVAAAPRGPGRPSAAAGIDQRLRLLDAAIALFGERGIAATPLREIARRAGVTPALLHYYFASKDTLVQTVLDERIAPFIAVSVAPLREPLPSPRATLRRFVQTHMRNIAANPWMPRLMAREVLSEGGALRAQMQAQFMATIAPMALYQIAAAQRRGEIRNDLQPLLLGLSLISLVVFPFAALPVWRGMATAMLDGVAAGKAQTLRTWARTKAAQQPLLEDGVNEALIAHTLTVIDSVLEPIHAKPKR